LQYGIGLKRTVARTVTTHSGELSRFGHDSIIPVSLIMLDD